MRRNGEKWPLRAFGQGNANRIGTPWIIPSGRLSPTAVDKGRIEGLLAKTGENDDRGEGPDYTGLGAGFALENRSMCGQAALGVARVC